MGSLGAPELLIVLALLAVLVGIPWIFYQWGASIAQGKGRSRSLGWWAVCFGFIGILGLAMMSDERTPARLPLPSQPTNVGAQLERLAELKDKGVLSPEEFEQQKRTLLG